MNPKTRKAPEATARRKRSPAAKFIFMVIKLLIIFFIAFSCAMVGIVGGAIYGYIKTTPPITSDQLQIKNFTSFIYDSKGNEIAQLKGSENRVWVDDKDIPKHLKDAFVALEDERFYEHRGIDLKRIASAVVSLVKPGGKVHGASTITQQLIKNLTNERQITLQRKVQEQWSALQLEQKLEKWQILELYLNLIYMGHGCGGVQSAAKAYFNKDVRDLSLAECAALAGITNNPAYYDPLTAKGREHLKNRQQICLDKMLELGYISREERDQADKEELKYVQGDTSELVKTSNQSYFVDQVVNDVKKDLMAQGMSEAIALKSIYNNGYKIYATVDMDAQRVLDDTFKNEQFFPRLPNNMEQPQAGMVVIDPKTGQIKAMYGGFGEKKGNTLNRATQIKRQVGSSMKPLAVYGPAIDQHLITPATVFDDVPMHLDAQHKNDIYPRDFPVAGWPSPYRGLITVRDAIAYSVNVVAAKVYMMNPDLPFPYLKKAGINRDNERYVSLALGGLKEGLSPLQMASAYVPFDNKGIYIEPSTYTKVLDKDGKTVLEKKPKSTIVYNETTAYVMNSMLTSVVTYGTGYPNGIIRNKLGKGDIIQTAGKTGTTNDDKDRWFVGYSPYYVAAVWYGYDTPTDLHPLNDLKGWNGVNPALKIWHEVMERLHEKLTPVDNPEPSGLTHKTICIYSGKPPTDLCAKDPRNSQVGSIRYNEVFIKGTEPSSLDVCDVHVKAAVDKDSKDAFGRMLLAGPYCPPESIIEQVFIQRKVEFKPERPGDPYPHDWIYELPEGEYCNIHGAPGSPTPAAVVPGAEGTVPAGVKLDTQTAEPSSTPPAGTEKTETDTGTAGHATAPSGTKNTTGSQAASP